MAEYKLNMILDGGVYKISYSKDGKQSKATIGNEKNITVMAARKICTEVEDLSNSDMSLELLEKMHAINTDAERCGYHGSILKYQNTSIEMVVKILYPDAYNEFASSEKYNQVRIDKKPLEILNVGCTGSGKTRFILCAVLSNQALRNFVPALTSLRETTACSIIYHLNSKSVEIDYNCDFKVVTKLKDKEEILYSIKTLIEEAVEEYISTIKEKCKEIVDLRDLCLKCRDAVEKRLEMNYDKTFGLGTRIINHELADAIECLTKDALMKFYGSSKSIDKIANDDSDFIIKQLIRNFGDEQFDISSDEINIMLSNYDNDEMVRKIYAELMQDLQKYNNEYAQSAVVGEDMSYCGRTEAEETLWYLSHVFGNKSKQRKGDFYTIEPIVKKAEFYLTTTKVTYEREIILSDSIGINQGQKNATRINEVVFNRIQESVQTRKPDIILYHTKLDNKDDYMLDVIRKLNAQGYGCSTYVVAGRLDQVLATYLSDNDIDNNDMDEETFVDFIDEISHIYIESDSVTLNSIIGDKYIICDKTNKLSEDYGFARDYACPAVINKVISEKMNVNESNCLYDDVDFMEIIQKNNIAGNVYQQYLDSIPSMIPMAYSQMRWNTLQKAIEVLRWNGFGFDVLYPAFNIKNAIADELNRDEIKNEFKKKFDENAEEMKRRYLLEVAEVAQIVLVTEYRAFMKKLLDMRYDTTLRTNLNLSMTDDRKHNLQSLYDSCLEQDGIKGTHALKIVFHIAWIRTLEYFKRQAQFSLQIKP